MASPAASSVVFLLCVFAASASAATFNITNNCSFILWPAAIPIGGGLQLNPGQTWTLNIPIGNSGRIWGRTGCSFNGSSGHCATGNCAGALSCSVSGDPPMTEVEFTITSTIDYYDISIIDGYNLAMDFSCNTGVTLKCREPNCPDAFLFPNDDRKVSACNGNGNYQVTFCP